MYFSDLLEFLNFLESKNHLKRISHQVKANLEITEISKRFLEGNGPALLFENVMDDHGKKYQMPLLSNLYAHKERISWGLGLKDSTELKDLGQLLAFIKTPKAPNSFKDAISMIPIAKRVISMRTKTVKHAKCQEVIIHKQDVNLDIIPIQKCWPEDAGPLITWPLFITKGISCDNTNLNKDTYANYNIGIYRMQKISTNQTIVRWLCARGGASHSNQWKKAQSFFALQNDAVENQRHKSTNALSSLTAMPAAIAIGANPYLTLAGVMPIPSDMSEYNFAGLLKGKPMELVKCVTNDIMVPADAQIILEGEVSLSEVAQEGPFGDHTGYYNEIEKFPIFTVNAITTSKNPIYLSTYTGKPQDEPSILGEALNDVFTPLIMHQFPEIVDFYLPPEGCSYRFAIVSINKTYPGQASRVMMGIWSFLKQFMYTKFIIVVDCDINIRDWKEVIWAISTRVDPKRDTCFIENSTIDYLDFASVHHSMGSKMGIDATNKIYPETTRTWGKEIKMSKAVVDKIDQIFSSL